MLPLPVPFAESIDHSVTEVKGSDKFTLEPRNCTSKQVGNNSRELFAAC